MPRMTPTPPLRRVLATALRAPFRVAHGCVRTTAGLRVEILPELEEPASTGLVTLHIALRPIMPASGEPQLPAAVARKLLRQVFRELAHTDPAIRCNACQSLVMLGGDAALGALRLAATKDSDPAVRAGARYALQKLRLPRYALEAFAGQVFALEFNARPATYITATTDAHGCTEFRHVPVKLTCRLRWHGTARVLPGTIEKLRQLLEQPEAENQKATRGTTASTNATHRET